MKIVWNDLFIWITFPILGICEAGIPPLLLSPLPRCLRLLASKIGWGGSSRYIVLLRPVRHGRISKKKVKVLIESLEMDILVSVFSAKMAIGWSARMILRIMG